eukprot:TRINITY_DN9056_c0_g1_i1.p1 TRINITY_DN9056_c0_g1~~TRINITY_DN9056_c0_g1_i1.p1  ORF type:complete len:477 (-),score=106.42 TRINITY_DN9056_c0_g1_i1:44-1474(-)
MSKMGKRGKLRKKRRIEHLINNLSEVQPSPQNVDTITDDIASSISQEDMAATIRVLSKFNQNEHLFCSPHVKQIRTLMYPLQKYMSVSKSKPRNKSRVEKSGLSNLITEALRNKNWIEAKKHMDMMRVTNEVPKIGAVQRWVRDCDAVGDDSPSMLRTLDAVIRLSLYSQIDLNESVVNTSDNVLVRFPSWVAPCSDEKDSEFDETVYDSVDYTLCFDIVSSEKAGDRNPPNKYDMNIHAAHPKTVVLDPDQNVHRFIVSTIPNAFTLQGVLSKSECVQMIKASEAMGYIPDEPSASGIVRSILANHFQWVVDEEMNEIVYNRMKPYLPSMLDGKFIQGINRRWRLYRYYPGDNYRPHIDGAWPGSGVDEEGNYVFDDYGDRWSKLTLLFYLNDGFVGGETDFFLPDYHVSGQINVYGVKPAQGNALVFPHGDTPGSLVHEGSAVLEGVKYIARTEILYSTSKNITGRKRKLSDSV